ncbi:bacteriocin immunity protein [Ligilactobacillus acidipiscis]|uniref:bacteriocin immunity protein n=1 Tax=Ligilactobacillus acidipiscis TaxID=89059 RepID=UPI0007054ADE|nr:bacteriocin immunity protein [Ligilactobacillus acidipiscis]GAW65199.1 prebacteriocin [Ligilactobacillus acidipiscis]GEN21552.1 hypothetical protein LAC02_48330 [Ligilactobacillus acidipiscis]
MTQENSKVLFDKIDKAFNDPQVEEIPELQKMLLHYATEINNNNTSYSKIVLNLSRKISSYYMQHHNIPKTVLDIYTFIKSEVDSGKIDSSVLKKYSEATGIMSLPISFNLF